MTLPRYQINVSIPVLARNRNTGTNDPPIIVRKNNQPGHPEPEPYTMAQRVDILGPSSVVTHPHGGGVHVVTDADLVLTDARAGIDQ